MKHSGKIAIITGAAQGIGAACAERLFSEGATIVISDIQQDAATALAYQLDRTQKRAVAIPCDVGQRDQVVALVAQTLERFGRLDIMVNNAAISCASTVLEITPDEMESVLNVNLMGTFWGTQEAAKVMVKQGAGAIVNMSSAQAELAIPDRVPYGISKAAIQQTTRIFAVALASKGVRVNSVGPGTILTPLTVGLCEPEKEAAYRRVLSRTPMGRLGTADEVASIVSFFASDDASYLTGQTIFPDGGRAHMNYTCDIPNPLPELKLP